MKRKVKVLIIDDSAIVRRTMTELLESDPEITVIGTAGDPYVAARKMQKETPDVITLDVEMPRMDGLMFLKKLMSQHPIPVIICSSLTETGLETGMKALEYGAVSIIIKPQVGVQKFLEESRIQICDEVKSAAKVSPKRRSPSAPFRIEKKLTADAILPRASANVSVRATTDKVVVIGASTGGTEALLVLIQQLPVDSPGVVVVQHMPEKFTASFARRLNEQCTVTVKEAENNDTVIPGRVLISPGNKHALLKRSGARYYVEIKEGPLVSRHRPSVDVLFRSASRYAGKNAIGVIMTGMGRDGAQGMLEMKEAGAYTIAQDEKTSVVYGMPREAVLLGGVDIVLPLKQIAAHIIKQCTNSQSVRLKSRDDHQWTQADEVDEMTEVDRA
jgi:two-component system, chemotaxis family, protein-glutamate methylesterase/glutaminase